ncbi:hypothetical protein Tco_0418434 [Tanacetum coccineum]
MTINEYLEYEAEMERRLRNVQSKRSPMKYKEDDFDSFYQDERNTFNYPYSHDLPPPHPCFLLVQPLPEDCLVSTNVSDDVDIESMTIAEYNLYVFFAQPQHTPNTHVDKKDSVFDEILDDLFRIGAENLKRMGHEKVQSGCDDNTSRDTNHESGNLFNFPTFPTTNEFAYIWEHDVGNINDLEK